MSSGRNGFRRDSNGFEPTEHIKRPQSNHEGFRDLTPAQLLTAQEHWDEADAARKARIENDRKHQEWAESPEGIAARESMRSMYTGF